MSVQMAKNNYTGLGGGVRMNCAQSVVNAFKEKYKIDEETINLFRAYGGGRAPGGVCGAYYAAKVILEKYDAKKAEEFEELFKQQAGAFECSNIKTMKQLSCVGCVEKSAEFLEKIG